MECPIIFVHKSDSHYLYSALKQAHITNPHHQIVLLGDETNNHYSWVKHCNYEDYFTEAKEFENHYIHHSCNDYQYELFCFQRWFVIKEFLEKELNDNTSFLYCDTDTLLFDSIDSDLQEWRQFDFTICRTGTPCFTYFQQGVLPRFCKFIRDKYTTQEGLCLINSYVEELKRKKRRYGISDMTAFSAFEREGMATALHIDIPKNGTSYHHNIIDPVDGYLMDGHYSKIIWKHGQPFGLLQPQNVYNISKDKESLIRFKGIHYQGSSKIIMYKGMKFPYNCYAYYLYRKERFMNKILNRERNRESIVVYLFSLWYWKFKAKQ